MEDAHKAAVLNTYRQLRLAMIVIVVVLGAAVLLQRRDAGCWQTSVSAYYYTAAHSVFIAALCAIGACLIVYKGSSDTEDAILNFSGFLAFVVAMMPTTRETICGGSSIPAAYDVSPGAGNNVAAVLITGVIAEAVRRFLERKANPEQSLSGWAKLSLAVGYVIIGAGTYEFVSNRPQFEAHAHTVSAVAMFAGIVLVILINALSAGGRGNAKVFVRLYGLIAITMGVALAIIVVIRWNNPDWSHLAIYLEFVLIMTFAVFWGVQTKELWNVSDRRELLPEGADPTGK